MLPHPLEHLAGWRLLPVGYTPGANLKHTLCGRYSNKTELLGLLWESRRGRYWECGAEAEESVLCALARGLC